jgi:hypothetical protein
VDYKPTTEEIAAIFATASPNRGLSVPERKKLFTEWLAEFEETAYSRGHDDGYESGYDSGYAYAENV